MGTLDWVRYVVAPVALGLLAAAIATRNARKTPHERLKNLVDIQKNMPEGIDTKGVVVGAIARELVAFDRRLKADQLGFWAHWRERALERGDLMGGFLGFAVAVTVALGLPRITGADGGDQGLPALSSAALTAGGIAAAMALLSLGQRFVRKERDRELADADAAARTVLREQMDDLLKQRKARDAAVRGLPPDPEAQTGR